MSDLRRFGRMFKYGVLGIAAMTVLSPGVALLRGTTGHDWYAATKLTAVEAAIAVGFDGFAPVVDYRRRDGRVERISRYDLYFKGEALGARAHIMMTARDYALLGAGIGGAMFLLILLGAVGEARRSRRVAVVEPKPVAYPWRPRSGPGAAWGAAERLAGRLGSSRARVALVVVSEAEFDDLTERDRVVDLVELPPAAGSGAGTSGDAASTNRALTVAPNIPAAPEADSDDSGPAAETPAPAPRRKREGKYERWA